MAAFSDSDILATVRRHLPDVLSVILFGSRTDGHATGESDLDLAVLLPVAADPVALWRVGEAIAAQLNVDVDLVDLRRASTVMQHRIVTTGRRLFAAGSEPDRYELFILAEMTALTEARAPLLADILAEGRVHG